MEVITLSGEPKSTNHLYKSTCRFGYVSTYLTPDGKALISGSGDGTLRFWDLATGSAARICHIPGRDVHALAVSPDGNFVASAGGKPNLHIWDVAAILPIVEEAGGRFTSWEGERTIARPDALTTNGQLHAALLALLREP